MSETVKESECLCGHGEMMVLACSGACDLGQVTDLVARRMRDHGVRKMNCLAVIGAGIEKSINDFKAKNILIIDGCSIDCGRKILKKAGFDNYSYLRLTDLGYKKGSTLLCEDVIQNVYEKAKNIF